MSSKKCMCCGANVCSGACCVIGLSFLLFGLSNIFGGLAGDLMFQGAIFFPLAWLIWAVSQVYESSCKLKEKE